VGTIFIITLVSVTSTHKQIEKKALIHELAAKVVSVKGEYEAVMQELPKGFAVYEVEDPNEVNVKFIN